jgi:hypothetical protein
MAQHHSTSTCKSNIKQIGKERAKEMSIMLGDWLREYEYYQENDDRHTVINQYLTDKYKLIRKTLKNEFANESDALRHHIRSLPNIWFYRNTNSIVTFCILFSIAFAALQVFLKLEIGITVLSSPFSGREIDLLEVVLYWPIDMLMLFLIIWLWTKKLDTLINKLSIIKFLLENI